MSGRKRIYVDEGEWNRLRQQARRLAELNRDLPRLVEQVRDQTQRDIETSLGEVAARHARFEEAVGRLSDRTREVEQQTARRLRATTRRLREEITAEAERQRADTARALRAQQETLTSALAEERAARERQFAEVGRGLDALRADQDRAARAVRDYLADAEVLREQVLQFPHERYLPGRLAPLDARLATVRHNVAQGLAAHSLTGAQEVCQSFSELRLELERLDQEWRACRIAAERELVALQGLVEQNRTLDPRARFEADTADEAPGVDHWSRGALSRLSAEIDAQLARVRDDAEPLPTEALLRVVRDLAPEFEQRLEAVVAQAVTAVQASQLRTNLAELIADALDEHHQYEVSDAGYQGADQRAAFLAKTVHHASGSEIVIEVEPGPDDQPPTVRLHNFDTDASEDERAARTRSIRATVFEHSGLSITAEEEAEQADAAMRDITPIIEPRAPQVPTRQPTRATRSS
ncbi:coiled-coil domain-containing protein [Goodfellowiella coeruleoviolacea]|uniref:Uncharacterized protein n=1 Tax=Goodfellowiella coeruleoviolacea TaxID=334858 RepID=A0AAE3GH72_9PSEU|nr:hypothetical protein [Goodfellowiella coeruleoviolacea]MCP2167295.1 hypothetical protein [Goodfellowiella coeruleoviolacea]